MSLGGCGHIESRGDEEKLTDRLRKSLSSPPYILYGQRGRRGYLG